MKKLKIAALGIIMIASALISWCSFIILGLIK